MKLFPGILLFLFLSVIIPSYANASNTEVVNGGFEEIRSGAPFMWSPDVYDGGSGTSVLSVESSGAFAGSHYVRIRSTAPNDAKWVQTVAVDPDTIYRFSCRIRAEGVGQGGAGANISVLGIGYLSQDLKDTGGKWEYVELIGKTGPRQREIQVAVRLGGYGSLNTGMADFDDFAMDKLAAAPAGSEVVPLDPQSVQGQTPTQLSEPDSRWGGFSVLLILYGLLYIVVFSVARSGLDKPIGKPLAASRLRWAPALWMGAAFAARLICAPLIEGHPIDFNDFSAWANHAYTVGLPHFYAGIFADYPPGYVYVLYAIGWLRHLLGIGFHSGIYVTLIKLPAMAADLASACLLYSLAKRRLNNERAALGLAMLYLLNPGVFLNSTLWAQIDSVFTLFALLLIRALTERKLPAASAAFAAALLIKPQTLMFAPLLLFGWIESKDRREWARSLAYGAGIFVVLVIPFSLYRNPLWIVELYRKIFGVYDLASFNAFNLYALFGANGARMSGAWLNVPYPIWDVAAVLSIVAFSIWLFLKSKHDGKYAYIGMLLALLVFLLKTGMHERYGYPALLLALVSYIQLRDKRILYLFLGVSLTHFANVAYVLRQSLDKHYFIPNHDQLLVFVSLGNVLLTAYAVKLGIELLTMPAKLAGKNRHHKNSPPPKKKPDGKFDPAAASPTAADHPIGRRDWLLMGAITAVYAGIALYHLGSLHAPQTFWKSPQGGSTLRIEFAGARSVEAIAWYSGIGDGSYAIDRSDNAAAWTPVTVIRSSGGTVFQWQMSTIPFTARYLRITEQTPGGTLGELAFLEAGNRTPVPIQRIAAHPNGADSDNSDAARLFDEQNTVPDKPSYLNGMYFDEIYHARTAYEHLHRLEPFETTHPPLGKVLISAGIALFGMNPFGWRIVGTLLGIAMIPILYLFAKRLFGRTEYAAIAAFLFAFDFMHFTQTRIATVDVFGVFFILLMYIFMYRYYTLNFYRSGLAPTWLPLGLAGLFFGIGTACKWIGLYAGAGLAVILLLSLRERYLEYRRNRKLPFPRYAAWTLAGCILFFLIVPAGIYLLSYIPFMRVPGPGHGWRQVIEYQEYMFDYHSRLVAQHPFASSWWEWPIIRKPIWYYAGAFLPAGRMSSIVAMGNPAVWWAGIAAAAFALRMALKNKGKDKGLTVMLIGLAAAYLPWIGVARLTFIYHFFAAVPFLILCMVYSIKVLSEKGKLARKWTYAYLGLVFILFVLFYPILSGAVIDVWYADHFLKWFNGWIFHA